MLLFSKLRHSLNMSSSSRRLLSSRASAILSSLDLLDSHNELPGVFDGEWKGSGEVLESTCPSTRETLACIKSVFLSHGNKIE